jgi:fibronectin type 3 domain-containing protein
MKTIASFCIIILFSLNCFSQTTDSWSQPGKNGIFIKFGKELPKGFVYRLDRKEASKNDWQFMKAFSVPRNLQETRSQLLLTASKNPIYGMADDSTINRFWKILSQSKICDSLYSYASNPMYLEIAGAGFFDMNVLPGTAYEYRITRVNNGKPLTDPLITKSVAFPGKKPEYQLKFSSVQANGNAIRLIWSFSKENHPYGIRVFRDVYLQTNPQEIKPEIVFVQQKDSIMAEITDREVAERMTYRYMIVPYDVFGNERSPSDAVLVVNLKPFGEALNLTKFTAKSADKENGIRLAWAYREKKALNRILIYRSDNFDSGFQRLADIPAQDTSYTDRNVQPVKSYYYFLVFDNVYGQSPPSSKVIGMLNPTHNVVLPPQQVGIKSLPEGNRIIWRQTEPGTKGYYVYRGGGFNAKLVQISPFIETDSMVVWYIDKKENLSPGITYSYAVKAVNTSSSISQLSVIVYANPVSRELPVPLNLRTVKYGKAVMLVWEDMGKIMSQITGYRVYRKILDSKKTSEFEPVCKLNITNSFVDSMISPGIHYSYAISSLGISDSESGLSQTIEFVNEKSKPFPPAGLRAIAGKEEVLLHWDSPGTTDIKEYRLYRETTDTKAELIATLKPGTTDYADKIKDKTKTFYYTVSLINLKGEESDVSDEVGVSLNQ